VAKLVEKLTMRTQRLHRFHIGSFSLKKLNELEGKEKHHAEISNRIAALENMLGKLLEKISEFNPNSVEVDMNRRDNP
jgi:hypothetical protein